MIRLIKLAIICVLPLAVSGCLLIPGKFASTMSLNRDGSFTFTYKGEAVFQLPDEKMLRQEAGKPTAWSDKMALCYSDDSKMVDEMSGFNPQMPTKGWGAEKFGALSWADTKGPVPVEAAKAASDAAKAAADAKAAGAAAAGAADAAKKAGEAKAVDQAADKAAEEVAKAGEAVEEDYVEPTLRKCTKKEIAELKTEWLEKQANEKRIAQEAADLMGRILGVDPTRPETMARFATNLQKHADWKSVVYKGDGVFIVDYQHVGRLDQDFIFPMLPEQQIIFPFVTIKRRADGSALVETPGYSLMSNGGLIGSMIAVGQSMGAANPLEKAPYNPLKNINGSFTLTTDGEVLANNTADGYTKTPTGKALSWQFKEARDPAPSALIKLR